MDPNVCVEQRTIDTVHCESAGQFLASIYNSGSIHDVPYKHVYEFFGFNQCLGGNSLGSIVLLYHNWTQRAKDNTSLVTNLRHNVTIDLECRLDFCKALEFSGNADFAGIGVIVSFCIQLSIATFFALFCLCCLSRPETIGKKWKAFRNTFQAFFISSVYFNVAICVAATSTIALENKTQHTAVFTTLGLLLSLTSTQTLWYLHGHQIKTEKRPCVACKPASTIVKTKWIGRVTNQITNTRLIKLCLVLLWIVLLALCASIIRVTWISNFEVYCFHRLAARPFAENLLRAPIGLVAFGLILAVLKLILKHRLPKNVFENRWVWVERATVVAGVVLMWFAFGTLWVLRAQVGNIAGEGYQDDNWGFGQVAAVATWLPTLIIIVQDSFGLMNQTQPGDGRLELQRRDGESSLGDGVGGEQEPPKAITVVTQNRVHGPVSATGTHR